MADILPCGCVMETVNDTFYYRPCSLLCQYYLYVVEQTKLAGNPIETRVEE